MLDAWRGKITPRQVLNLVDRLPRHSHLAAAMANDDELAELIDEDAPAPAPPLTDFSADHQMLTLIADRIGELIRTTAQANSTKTVPPIKPLPRPETALQRKARRRKQAKRDLITDRLAKAKAAGRPTMSDLAADPMHALTAPRRRNGR
jgi:hypothetical protein